MQTPSSPSRIGALFAWLLFASMIVCAQPASAKDAANAYPAHVVKVVLPFAPGSVTDLITRVIAERLTQRLGQPFVVENRAGGDGSIGAGDVAHATPDGYTLLFTTNTTHSIIGSLLKHVPYDPQRDFTPVAKLAGIPSMVVVNPGLPVKTIEQFVAYARANPGKINYGYGNSSGQIGGETLQRELGIRLVAVPYKGNPQAAQDVMAGHIEAMVIDVATAQPLVKAGRLRALAMLTDKRMSLLPAVPTVSETVAPGFDIMAWFGVFGPAGMPPEIVALLAREMELALKDPAIDARLRANGIVPSFAGPAAFAPFLQSEQVRWTSLAKHAGIEPQ
jgi:tripartite-type tricarboxylate transporter receptor subunit TctC